MYDSNNLKKDFNEIKILRESVENLLISLSDKIKSLNIIYKDLITNNINETQTGLDSLHFQSKLINYELKNNYDVFNMIDNHMYCNYYKLYKSILKYLQDTIKDKNIISGFLDKQFPIYKDLDSTTKYDFEISIDIFNTIIQVLDTLNNEYLSREHKFNMENNRKKTGINIDNLVNSLKYNNNNMKNNMDLFIDNLLIFNNFHNKYLTRFSLRTKLLYGQIDADIRLEESRTNVNFTISGENICLENDEEKDIRNYINSSNINRLIEDQTAELNSILSGIINNNPFDANCSSKKSNISMDDNCKSYSIDNESNFELEYNLNNNCSIL